MSRRTVSIIVLMLLLFGMLITAFNVQFVRVSGIVYTDFAERSLKECRNTKVHVIEVPWHSQLKWYYCACASLEMIFDYWGPDVSQYEIANAMWTNSKFGGTAFEAIVRGAHFSNVSTSLGGDEPSHNVTGYGTRGLGYAGFIANSLTLDELKTLIDSDYPIIIRIGTTGYNFHVVVVVGYNDTAEEIIIHDPLSGPYQHYNYSYFMSEMWYAPWFSPGGWAAFVAPWNVSINVPSDIKIDGNFTVNATINYLAPKPFAMNLEYPAVSANATIILPNGISLAPGEDYTKTLLNGTFFPRNSTTISWRLIANNYTEQDAISVIAQGTVSGICNTGWAGFVPYTDRIGGIATFFLDDIPPNTVHDYDGEWHIKDFYITLTAIDDGSGVAETYYRINNGPTKAVSVDGQPLITTEGTNNTLEYWSVDNCGNEELPHKILTGIKLDRTPPTISIPSRDPVGDVQPDQTVKVSVNVSDATSHVKNVTLYYSLNNGTTWEPIPMNLNSSTSLYETATLGQPAGTLVRYKIVAYDHAGNNKTLDGMKPYCIYRVVPEFPPSLILSLFIMLTLLADILYKNPTCSPKNERTISSVALSANQSKEF